MINGIRNFVLGKRRIQPAYALSAMVIFLYHPVKAIFEPIKAMTASDARRAAKVYSSIAANTAIRKYSSSSRDPIRKMRQV